MTVAAVARISKTAAIQWAPIAFCVAILCWDLASAYVTSYGTLLKLAPPASEPDQSHGMWTRSRNRRKPEYTVLGKRMFGIPVEEIAWLAGAIVAGGLVTGMLAGMFGIGGGGIIVPVLYEVFRALGV